MVFIHLRYFSDIIQFKKKINEMNINLFGRDDNEELTLTFYSAFLGYETSFLLCISKEEP